MSTPLRSHTGPAAGVWRGRQFGKHLTANLMRAVPIGVYQRVLPRRAIGMCYHVVSDRELPHVRNLYRYKSPAQFEADLIFLKRHFHLASYEELRSGSAPPNSVIVTFDDGLVECYSTARPLLLQHRVPCIFFVSPPHLDNARMYPFDQASLAIGALQKLGHAEQREALRWLGTQTGRTFAGVSDFARWLTAWIRTLTSEDERVLDGICSRLGVDVAGYLQSRRPYLTREQVVMLAQDGFTIGGHGLRHVALGSLPEAQARREILESCRAVSELTGAAEVPFAFPFDADGVDRDLLSRVRSTNPEVGLFFDTRQLRDEGGQVVNRLIVDVPALVGGTRSNLGGYLRNAYLEEMLRALASRRGDRGFGGDPSGAGKEAGR